MAKTKFSNWLENASFRNKNKGWLRYSSNIARRILSAIENEREMSQVKLAEALEVSPQRVSKILKGSENLTLETIAKISSALNVELITFPDYKYNVKNNIYSGIVTSNNSVCVIDTGYQTTLPIHFKPQYLEPALVAGQDTFKVLRTHSWVTNLDVAYNSLRN